MTRILVVGCPNLDEPTLVHNTLCDLNKEIGPITCVIHQNHPQALAWQQWVSLRQVTRHLPVIENPRDGVAAPDRCRDRLIAAKPDYVVVFDAFERRACKRHQLEPRLYLIVNRAQREGIPVLTYASRGLTPGATEPDLKFAEAA